MKLRPRQLEAIARMIREQHTGFALFMEALGDYGEQVIHRLVYEADGEQAEYLRGQARAVSDILRALDTAVSDFDQMQRKS